MEKFYEYKQELVQLFVDYKQALDSISRESLLRVIKKLWVPVNLIRMIRMCVQNPRYIVKLNGQLSK